ncbi:TonB-dependent receptor [Pontibacter sp. G13]|uniref:SusC/RagA family TonB-linked outer membrane protein n=1 Tax=Pontibacter sp. G13 TaxID=3074898 RepID=UPI00288A5476|nr:TonB-dependent receptor [Pontibacter sp. G13]WNJ19239.1 TonB-dependent receptor [Pontibacter sp. G13]
MRFFRRLFSLWIVAFCCLLVNDLIAQGSISGKVADGNGDPIIGATVLVQGTQNGALTDESGGYRLQNVAAGDVTVMASFLGFEKKTATATVVNGQNITLNFSLEQGNVTLEEVVMVGYGTARKRDLVGSVAQVTAEDLNETIGASVETSLQGKAPGVQIVQSSGVAGGGSVIRVRGIGSISSSGDPLIVVDGIPITQDPFLQGETGGLNNNPLSSLNPNDIETIDVLKDASAAAIYGSRGANGVILITTKRGKTGKPVFEFSSRIGTSQPTNVLEFLNAEEWVMVQQEAWENDGNTGRYPLPQNLTYEDIEGVDTDWIDQVIHTGIKQEYNLSFRQGGKKLNTYAGVSYSDAESYQIGNSFKRLTARANVDYRILPNLSVQASTSLAGGLKDQIDQAWSGGLGFAQSTALPIFPVTDENGDWFNLYGNPVAQRELKDWRTLELRSINNVKIAYSPVKDLNISASGSFDYMDLGDYFLEDSLWTTVGDISKSYQSKVVNFSGFLTADYSWEISPSHRLDFLGGLEYQESRNTQDQLQINGLGELLYNNPDASGMDTAVNQSYEIDRWKFASVFTRVKYTFKDKFMVQGTYRRDGSSRFGPNRRFGDFPAIGAGYIISEESWFENPVVNYMKLKASWGLTGNAGIGWREQFPGYYYSLFNGEVRGQGYNGNPVRNQTQLSNPDLQWERNSTIDGGIELGFFNDRLTMDFTYYYKKTSDAVIFTSLQASSGLEALTFAENVGEIENKGVEFSLRSYNIKSKNFQWTTDFNIARNQNKVLDVGTATPDALDGGFGDTRAVPGYPVNTNFIVQFSHVDENTGRPVYLTADGEETTTYSVVGNRVPAGAGIPEFTGGLTNSFKYKGFDFNFLFVFSVGGEIYDDAAKRQLGVVTSDWNMRREVLDRWRAPGDQASYPQLTHSMINWGGNANFWQNNHTLWMEDASYARLRNVSLSYTLPKAIMESLPFDNLRFTVSGTNLLTFTNYSGWDPEVARGRTSPQQRNVGGTNVTYLVPPQEKTMNFGVNLTF